VVGLDTTALSLGTRQKPETLLEQGQFPRPHAGEMPSLSLGSSSHFPWAGGGVVLTSFPSPPPLFHIHRSPQGRKLKVFKGALSWARSPELRQDSQQLSWEAHSRCAHPLATSALSICCAWLCASLPGGNKSLREINELIVK